MQQMICEILYYAYILIFGVYSAMILVRGSFASRERKLFLILCPVLLIAQGILLELIGIEWVWRLYPLIAHLPIALAFALFLHVKWDAALLSVLISYSLCQLMRWVGLVVGLFCSIPVTALIIHLSLCLILLFLMDRYCLRPIHEVLCKSKRLFRLFGALPVLYYIYEYFMLYTQQRYAEVQAFQELLPTAMVLFFAFFTILLQREAEKRRVAEQQNFMLEMKLEHAGNEIDTLRRVQEQTSIYRHDMHHHLSMISALIASDQPEQAATYISRTVSEIEAIVPRRYCENDTVNLLLSSFGIKAERRDVSLSVKAELPGRLCLDDTELCVILSNALENALNATAQLPECEDREIGAFLGIKQNKLLIEIKNPYTGSVIMQDDVPVAQDQERHYGCRSILSVVQRRNGICSFEAKEGIFRLQIAIPFT